MVVAKVEHNQHMITSAPEPRMFGMTLFIGILVVIVYFLKRRDDSHKN